MNPATNLEKLAVFAADVGKPKNLGWAKGMGVKRSTGVGPESFALCLANAAKESLPIALGFESPLFLPVAKASDSLLKSRLGEGRRAWSAGAAPAATVSGIVAMSWILRRFGELAGFQPTVFTDWDQFVDSKDKHPVFVWEAFISERQQDIIDVLGEPPTRDCKWVVKDKYHLVFDKADAITAVNAFLSRIGNPTDVATPLEATAVSLVHTVLSWLGWSTAYVPPKSFALVRKDHKPNWDAVPGLIENAGDRMPVQLADCFMLRKR